jgi:hypothetical protein
MLQPDIPEADENELRQDDLKVEIACEDPGPGERVDDQGDEKQASRIWVRIL